MKNRVPFIVIGVMLILVVILIASAKKITPKKQFNPSVTLKERDKIPYGMSAAKELLPTLFSDAAVYTEDKAPGRWNHLTWYETNQAVILTAKKFEADEYQLNQLVSFVKDGNHALIIAKSVSTETAAMFGFGLSEGYGDFVEYVDIDSVSVKLEKSSFSTDKVYTFPGVQYESWFSYFDSAHAVVLGRNAAGKANFIQMKIGAGTISIHVAPIAFSNYFILHKNNIEYYEKAMSVIPRNIEKVVWDEYYLDHLGKPKKKDSLFRVLFRYPGLKWGLSLAGLILLLYLLMYMRRRQRAIPVHEKPKNDSLDFVKTMGRLYYERKDHRNLALKMSMYFLEHVRTNYKLATNNLDREFQQQLQHKSGYSKQGIDDILSFIRYLKTGDSITELQLAKFHSQLESFYQNT